MCSKAGTRLIARLTAGLLLAGWCEASAGTAQPNFLIAIADDWSFGHAGAYGCSWVKTPAFDRVAHEGVLFMRAYTPTAKCAPSRACILTGRNPWQLKAGCNHYCFFPSEFKTYPEALGENGYAVGSTGKGWAPGTATNDLGLPREMTGKEFQKRKLTPPTKGIAATDYAGNFREFLKASPAGKPWCFWYGAYEPHRRFEYGTGVSKGGKKTSDIGRVPAYLPDTEVVRNDLLDYAYEVENYDTQLGRMLEMLEAAGALSNTVVIATSDNGMSFPRAKSQCYEDSNHMPLAIMWRDGIRQRGRVIDDYVSFTDLAPTIVALANLNWRKTGMAAPAGESLATLLFSRKSGQIETSRDHVLLGKERFDVGRPNDWGYPVRGIVKNDMLYLRNYEASRWPAGNPETGYLTCDGSPSKTVLLNRHRKDSKDGYWELSFGLHPETELFDLRKDPECLHNLAGQSQTSKLEGSLERQMSKELKAQGDPRMFGRGKVFEEYPYSDPRYRDFYNRFMAGEKLLPGWVNETDFEEMGKP
jgi:N-sulfoglucosamine sulfohydrolase